ncbi:unnamed protein product [Clonostachys rhizophaga]|uniref:Rhodopsin domain-containing protein n=1 Tax=Clonostachys rhizophaga TaxID=160324 RepID=A0A9N9VT08_9HYPO|nr:unnamed protein product [Clonostachys rhizophaga]
MNDDDLIVVIGAIGAVLSIIIAAIRFYGRHMMKSGVGLDDWFLLLSVVTLVIADVIVVVESSANVTYPESAKNALHKGKDDAQYTYGQDDIDYTRLSFFSAILYFTTVSTTKLSILLMYKRIFSIDRSFRLQIIALIVITAGFWISMTVSNLLNCIPIEMSWVPSDDESKYCFNYNVYWLACGIVECILDLVILIMPVRVVYGLKLSQGRRIAVAGVFLLGVFVIISGIVKVARSYIPGSRQLDLTQTSLWSTVHICTGIICACLPVCWPVFLRMVKRGPLSKASSVPSNQTPWSGGSGGRRYPQVRGSRSGSKSKDQSTEIYSPQFGGSSDVHELLVRDTDKTGYAPPLYNQTGYAPPMHKQMGYAPQGHTEIRVNYDGHGGLAR